MNKKQYLEKLLEYLWDEREHAKALNYIVKNTSLDKSTIDQLFIVFSDAVSDAKKKNNTKKIEKAYKVIKRINQAEEKQKAKDSQEIENFEKFFEWN